MQDTQDPVADCRKAISDFTATVELLYPKVEASELGIKSQHVLNGPDMLGSAAIAAMAAHTEGVTYYVGIFRYRGVLLRGMPDSTYEVIDPGELGKDTLQKITQELAAKTTKLGKRLGLAA